MHLGFLGVSSMLRKPNGKSNHARFECQIPVHLKVKSHRTKIFPSENKKKEEVSLLNGMWHKKSLLYMQKMLLKTDKERIMRPNYENSSVTSCRQKQILIVIKIAAMTELHQLISFNFFYCV